MTRRESKVMRSFQFKLVTQIERGEFESVTLKNKYFVKWLVGYLATRGYPFEVARLGPGVVRIIRGGMRCPYCGGKGVIADGTGKAALAYHDTECPDPGVDAVDPAMTDGTGCCRGACSGCMARAA